MKAHYYATIKMLYLVKINEYNGNKLKVPKRFVPLNSICYAKYF